jgi:hypothetical protein
MTWGFIGLYSIKSFADFVGVQNHLQIFTHSCAFSSLVKFKYQSMTKRQSCNVVAAAPKTKRQYAIMET